jgi:hypothetical protein
MTPFSGPVFLDGEGQSEVRVGSKTEVVLLERQVRSTPKTRHRQTTPLCPFRADFVAEIGVQTARDG